MAAHMADRLGGWTGRELEQLNTALLRLLPELSRTSAHN